MDILARYWPYVEREGETSERTSFTEFSASLEVELDLELINKAQRILFWANEGGDVRQWVVGVCFLAHPHLIWNLMLYAVDEACSDRDLSVIATYFAEHLLAQYGSLIEHFENRAAADPKFYRMLTGVWRHRTCDAVWHRVRALQATAPAPLAAMIPLSEPFERRASKLSEADRCKPDKGLYLRDGAGDWARKTAV